MDTNNIYLLDLLMESFITIKKILGEIIVGTIPVLTSLVGSKLDHSTVRQTEKFKGQAKQV